MAFWNKKKKDEEESTKPSSSTDSAPTSRAARAVRDLFNATVQGQQKAVQADQAVARAGQQKLADAAQNIYSAAVRGQQAAVRADQSVAREQNRRVTDAAAGLYSAYQQQQERAARDQMAAQRQRMQAPTRRAQDAAAGLYSAYLNQQQSGIPMIQAPTPRAAEAANALRSITAPRRQNSAPTERDDGILANLFRQQAGEMAAQDRVREGMIDNALQAGSAVFNFVPNRLATGFNLSDEEQMRNQLRSAGFSDSAIDDMIARGEVNPTARYDRTEGDSFLGKATANYNMGELSQQADILIGQGIITGNREFLERGNELRRRAAEYSARNEEALNHDSGMLGNMLAENMAQYAPQATYQQLAAAPYQPLAMMGKYGEAAAQALGSGSLSYTTMAGGAYANLVDKGVDPEKAARLAKDEAAVSAAIEMGDTFMDWAFGPAKNLNPFAGVGEKMARSTMGRVAMGMGRYALNVGQETAEEALQEIVSIANERRAAEGNAEGGILELLGYVMDEAKETMPELYDALKGAGVTERAERVAEAGKGGAVIAAFMGLLGEAGGAINTRRNRAQANRYLDSIVDNTDSGEIREMTDGELNEAAEAARELNRADAAEIFENERARRNEQADENIPTAEPEMSSLERTRQAMERFYEQQENEAANYDEDAAFIGTDGNPVLWNTTDQRHAALLNGRGGLNAAINDGYIRIKRGEGIELAVDNGVLSPQQAQAIRKLVDGFTGNTFRVDMDVMAGDDTQTIGALEFEGADIDGRRIVDAINREIRRNSQQNVQEEISPDQLEGQPVNRPATVEESMTMDEARRAIQYAFNLYERESGDYRTADEWVKNADPEDIALLLENDEKIVEQYLNKIPNLWDSFDVEDIVKAYKAGTLTGKVRARPTRMDTSIDTGRQDDRFYAPRIVQSSSEMWDAANQRVTNENRQEVYQARKNLLFFAHQPDAAEELGLTQKELNAKLRSWSNYSANGRQVSQRINQGVAAENQWTGIQNCSAISKATVTDADIESMVKAVEGESDDYRRNYVGRTMLALDTHIDWSWLTIRFLKGPVYEDRTSVRGVYRDDSQTIEVGGSGNANTVAHEMGHALDSLWGRQIFGSGNLTSKRTDAALTDPKAKQFFKNFRLFIDSLNESSDIRSQYTASDVEVFGRFIASFVEWTDRVAGNNFYSETNYYGDKFTQAQYVEFARLLQEKSALEATTDNTRQYEYPNDPDALYTQRQLYSYDFLTNQEDMQKTELPRVAEVEGKTNAEIAEAGLAAAEEVGNRRGDVVDVKNRYTGRILALSKSAIRHSIEGNKTRRTLNSQLGLKAGELVQNAIPINGLTNENKQASGTYALISYAYDNAGNEYIAVIHANHFKNDVTDIEIIDIPHSISGRKNNNARGGKSGNARGNLPDGISLNSNSGTISIADLLEVVNDTYRSILSDDVLNHFNEGRPANGYYTGRVLFDEMQGGGDIRRQLADAEREYMEHSDANDAEYDYRAQLEKINDLRRQIEEAESVNAEADNINAETDTNPTIEALEREGRVSRGTYDVEKYGDTHPERGEVGRDGVRMCNTTADLEAELNEIGGARIRNDTGEYFARIRRKNDNGYLLTINRNGKRDTSRSFGNIREASAYAASYIEGQTQARTDAELDNEKSAPVPRQEPIEALTTGQVQDEAKRQKQNKAAEASTQSLRDKIRKTDEEIKALRRLEKTTGLTETQAKHKADLQETLEILNDELTSRKGRAKAKKENVEVKGNKPARSAAEAKNRLMEIFHTAPGQRADTNTKLEAKLAEIVSSEKITEQNREDILDMLIDAGMVRQEAEQEFRDVRDWLRGSRIFVSEHDRADFGDDWEGIRKSAWANGIYLTSNESDRSVDSLVSELAETFGTNMFPTDDAPSDMVRNLIEQAEKGRSSMITFAEAVNNEARMEHVDPQEIWNDLSRQADETLRAFAEKAKLEMDLKDRTASMLATERKRAEDRMERMAQRRRESEIREKTMKAIKRLARLRGKAAPEVRTQIDEALKDIDTQARQLTINGLEDLQELARVYEDAKKAAGYESEENPGNFISNPYIEQRLARLTQKHINDMDIDDVIELGRLVSALENTVKTNGKMIGEQFDSEVKTVADKVNAEVQSSRGAKPGFLQKWFAEEQLSPRRFLELLGGWKKGAMAELADSLEKGQTKMLDFQRRAAQLMDPFMSKKENRKWLKTASGKNAKWYTYSVANGMATDGSGITGQTIEITPMMKVSLYLASLNEDNLRHIQTGGLRIPDKALYIKGKTQEAFAQGQIVKMQPQAVRAIASSLTQEEKTFAGYLQKFFDNQSKNAINEVSMQLDGFERAGVDNYFPIESDRSFIKSDVSGEARAQTVEGIGSISNDRVHAGNPIRLDDAYNVFMRQVTNVSRYYGYAIPIRNFQAVNNYVFHEEGNAFAGSIKDTINRKWGAGAENYITKMLADIQGASSKGDMTSRFLSMLRGNLAGATLAVNPSVAVSQTASYPGAAQAVGWDGLAAGLVSGPVDEKLIEKYTPLLWYRSQGYSTQEIGDAVSAQNKSLAQKALASKALNWIQTMDRLAVKRIWKAAEYRVTKDTGLKPGSKALIDSGMDPYYQKVAEVFNRAVYDTQPNYTDMERAQILRSDSDITKFLTMYKTVPLQYYGMTAEAVGRMQAALKSGNKTEIRAARKYAADTFGGLLAANSVYVIMKALFKSFRGKDKDYRDEEGEITPESYFKQLGKDLAETYAGSIIGGAEAYSLITGWINGDKFRAPEINVLSSVEDIANGFQSIFKAIDDDDPGKTAKAVKDAAENIAMVCGLPVKNVETYLMAAIRYIQPQTAMQYDSFFGGLSKGDLKGMDSDTIGSAASIIMNSRTGANMERAATDELSRLYAAGYTDAIPTAIQDSFEYAGNTVKIKDRGKYSETWGGVVGDNLEELTANESYINADDKTKEDMIRKLYQYATVQARMGADPEYTAEGSSTYGWTEKADAAMESGMDLPTVIAAMTTMNAMTADKVNGQTVKTLKSKRVEYIDSLRLDTEQKDALYELAGYESGLEKAPWHSGISAEAGYATGTNKPVINEAARKRAVEANYRQLTSSAAYKAADDQTKKAMIEKLNQYAEVQGMVTTDPDYLPTGTAGWTIWAETAEKAGIDLISAIDYATQLDSFKADYNEYGKAISGSKKDKVTKYIDALDLTNEQKDILYLKIYAENSLKYTPWHGYTGKKKKRRGGGRRGSGKKSTAAKKPVSVGKITPKYSTGIDISTLFPTTGSSGRSGTGKTTGLSTDLAKIVNSGLDISELFKLPTTGTKAPRGRTKVDFRI